ncbi:MAG: dTDP-4-dehydrorhamnose 3,5-epimerase [Selenomonadaceae bacterium]|nr:dTDP-4-dehydrorhamnose 3,5-epimerase [Selenomonadaceae bacterium]
MKDSRNLFERLDTPLPGCYEIIPCRRSDSRGTFIKTVHEDAFKELGLEADFVEQYYSVSKQHVLRGLHFQLPPSDHAKLVYCIEGRIFDVAVDLRHGSAAYGHFHTCELSAENGKMLYIPKGMAHGFYTLSQQAVVMYNVTSLYDAERDSGILWNSLNIPWPVDEIEPPVISERDKNFCTFAEFSSPFTKRALLTGITGFVGSHLAEKLLAEGWEVHGIVRENSDTSKLIGKLTDRIKLHMHNDRKSLNSIMAEVKPEVVFHLASLYLSSNAYEDIPALVESNVTFGTLLVEAMINNGCCRLVNTGTSWQHYQNKPYSPVNLYAASKQAFDDMLQYYVEARELKVIELQLFDTYGADDKRQKLLNLLRDCLKNGRKLSMSPGEQLLNLVHIDDVVSAFSLAGNYLLSGDYDKCGTYAVVAQEMFSLRELVERIEQLAGGSLNIEFGGRPYRAREVMKPWIFGNILPGWQCKIALDDGLQNFFGFKECSI